MAYYLFNTRLADAPTEPAPHDLARSALRVGLWGVDPDEAHGDALATGDLVLIYLAAPQRLFVGSAELASPVHDWTSSEAAVYAGDARSGVSLAQVEAWDPPVSMQAVLTRIGPSETAKADFSTSVVQITAYEYECARAVAGAR